MVTIQQARTQIQEQKQLLAGKREEASKTQTQLRDVLSKLPQVTQRALRGAGSFAGLKGRLKRRVLERTKKDIGEKEELIKSYGTSLTKYEEETLKPFEGDVARVESQIAQAKVEEAAFEKAQKLFEDKISPYWVTGPEYKYLKRFYEEKASAKKAFYSQVEQFQTDFPAEKLEVDWEKLRIKEVDSETFGQTLSIKDYNKRIADLRTTEIPSESFPDFPEVQGLSVIELPPKELEIFKRQVAMKGPITGTLSYGGGLFERKLKKLQVFRAEKDPSYEPYQEAATRKLVGLGIQTAPYFTPAGPTLLVGTGFESLIFPEGKRQREQMQLGLEEKGFGRIPSKIAPYSIPALEIGLGAYGIKGQAQGFFQTQALKKPPTTIFMAEEATRRGVSEIDILAKTRIGKQDYYGVVKQVGIPGPKGFDVLISKGYTITPELKVIRIPKTPYGKTIEVLPMTEKISRIPGTVFGKTTRAIKGEPFIAVGVGRELGPARYYGKDLFGRAKDIGRGAEARYAIKIEDKIIKGRVVGGFQKGEGEIVKYIGGRPTKLKITKKGKVSFKAKPTIFGFIQKAKPKVKEMEFDILPSGLGIKVQKQVQEQIVSQVSALEGAAQEQAKKQSVAFFKKSKVISKGGMIPLVSAKQEVIPQVKQKTVQVSGLVFEQISKQKAKPFLISGVREKQKQRVKQVQKQVFKTLQEGKTIPLLKVKTTLREKLFLRTPQKVKQKTKQRSRMIPILKYPGKPKTPPKIIKLFDLEKEKEKRKRLKKKGRELFIPFVKRYGKFAAISQPTTLKRALRKGTGRLLTTLGASLQIRGARTGKPIKIAKETKIFRAGKKGKDPFTLVQRRGARLGRRQEVMEIIKSRGMKWF